MTDQHGPDVPLEEPATWPFALERRPASERPLFRHEQRRFLPSLADLIDRMSIVLQKEIFIACHREQYRKEMAAIMHDIDLILAASECRISAKEIHAICVVQLANAFIWANETKVRDGSTKEPDSVVLRLLLATHAVNGVRANGKNKLSEFDGGRVDYKVDCFAADLVEQFGNWNVFGDLTSS